MTTDAPQAQTPAAEQQVDLGATVRQLLGDALGYLYPAALRVAVRLGIADLVADTPKTADELAVLTRSSPDHLYRVLRFLATRGVFAEDESHAFRLLPAGALLRSGSPVPLAPLVLLFTDPMYWEPTGRLEDTVRKGATRFEDIFGSQFFDYVAQDEQRLDMFQTAMAALSGIEHGAIADSYEFGDTGTVIDVAGGRGGMLRAVLARNPGLHGVLVDRDPVLRTHQLDAADVAGRWSTATGDFFEHVPAGAEYYLLKRILHDKTDSDCVRILRTCRRAMGEQSRLLVIDAVLPPGNAPHPHALSDLLMMSVFEGRERTADEVAELLAAADLELSRTISTGVALSIVEAVPRGQR